MSYIILALFSALTASLVAIFGKLGLKNVDPTIATTIRSLIMAVFLVIVSLFLKKFENFSLNLFNYLNRNFWCSFVAFLLLGT
jgi:transporter family protein